MVAVGRPQCPTIQGRAPSCGRAARKGSIGVLFDLLWSSFTVTTDGSDPPPLRRRPPVPPRPTATAVAERTRMAWAVQRGQTDGSADMAMGRASEKGPQVRHSYS